MLMRSAAAAKSSATTATSALLQRFGRRFQISENRSLQLTHSPSQNAQSLSFPLFYSSSPNTQMELEVKLRIPDSPSHRKLSELLFPFHLKTHIQENVFFDGSEHELSSKRAILRLRFYDGDSRCVVSLKGKAVLVDGISRVEEVEEDIDVSMGRACVKEPLRLCSVDCGLLKKVLEEYQCKDFVCLGGFGNVRAVHDWEGLKLELDETHYDFGTSYELECENVDPETAKKKLEGFLTVNGIPYSYSEISKFATFRSGKLPE